VEGNPDLVLRGTEILSVSEDNSSSGAIVPGQEFYLRTSVKNAGNGEAKNVRVMLDLNNSSPLIPLEDNVRFFENLSAGSSENLSFKLFLGSNADVQPYRIPLRITASNNIDTFRIDKVQEIGINVLNRAQIDISSLKFDPGMPVKGQQVSLTLRLENVGEGEARSVKARIEEIEGSGNTGDFLGRLDKDDDAPAVFTFTPEKTGDQNVALLVEYEDDFGEHQVIAGILRLIENTLGLVRNIMNAIGLLIAFVIIFVVIYVNIVNKKRQIGVQKAIGIEQNVIVASFVLHAMLYAGVGVILGYAFMRFGLVPYTVSHPVEIRLAP
jgi:hypothetical protein